MANKDDYLRNYREFFEYFAQTVNPNDQLPVKLASYKFLNVEVVGGIIDWTTQYLTQKKCPPHLFSPLIKIIIDETRKSCKKQPVTCGFNSAENAYEPLKLMQAVMAKTNEVCLRYLDNSMLCSLPSPSNTFYETSIYAIRNKRRKMEDRHVAINDLNTLFNIQEASPSSYYAIFDGHAGHDAAAYSAAHLHQFLAENKYFVTNPEQALLDAFCKTDALFIEKCKVENLNGGTTAVVALLRPKEKTLYVAWVGDSQALLVKQGKILQCVNPHKPCREDERERIEKAGGCVMLWGTWRVNGQLAVSRAIGDVDYKPHVIAIPDVREISLDGDEDFLIIACDGLWDYLSEDAAAQEVYYLIAENPDDTERISNNLSQLARYEGSADNISVIVVFLREPHKIAAEAQRWATRNGPPLTTDNMEAGLDNANNPFTNSNGSLKNLDVETDNIHLQKSNEGLLLNLTDNFKANGTDLSQDIFEKSNGTKNSSSDIHFDDGFGPETDVDAVDDAFSPVEKSKTFAECLSKAFNDEGLPKSFNDEVKAFSEGLANNNPLGNDFNPFLSKELEDRSKDDIKEDFEEHGGDNREETPTPPVDTVHDVGGLEENPGESDSEDEWNYFKGDQAKPETLPSQPETVVETSELEDAMSQLNPNAAEFVPVSPTRSIPSPACRALINDEVISQSPKRPVAVDIKVPNETEFESEVKSRPSDFDAYSNGHDSDSEHNVSGTEQMENILNGKSIDEIPEFQPGSTPAKQPSTDEFHFGPNAAPFTPRPLDQSEALSTKANYGDDTEQTLNTSFNDSELAIPHKDSGDPMSMSFSAERGESNPFQDEEDLNKVHDLPENIDEFLENVDNKENWTLDGTISDLPQHDVLGYLDNDQAAIQTTDLDKLSQEDEKELASPLEPEQDLQNVEKISSATPDLLEGGVAVPEKLTTDDSNISSLPELEPLSAAQLQGVSFIPEPQPELGDSRLSPEPGQLDQQPQEVQSISPVPDQLSIIPESKSPLPDDPELMQSKSPLPEENELIQSQSPLLEEADVIQSKSPLLKETELIQSESPVPEETKLIQSRSPLLEEVEAIQSKSPLPEDTEMIQSRSLLSEKAELMQSKSPQPEETESIQTKSPLLEETELIQTKSPLPEEPELIQSRSPLPAEAEMLQSKSPLPEETELIHSKSPLLEEPELIQSRSPLPEEAEMMQSKSPLLEEAEFIQERLSLSEESELNHSKSSLPEETELIQPKSPLPEEAKLIHPEVSLSVENELNQSKSPLPDETELIQSKSPVPPEQEIVQQPELDESRLSSLPGQPDFNQEVQAELLESKSPVPVEQETEKIQQESDLSDSRLSPLPGQLDLRQQEVQSVSPTPEEVDLLQSKSPISAQPEPEKQETNLLDVDDKVVKESDVLGELKSQGPVEEFTSGTKSPFDDIFESKSPVCQLKPSDMFETEFNPKREVETLELEAKISDLSRETALACEFSADPAVCELQQHSSEAMPVSHSPFDSHQEYKQDEEITSSIKDDISSPIELLSPVKSPEPLVDESFTADHTKPVESEPVIIEDSFVQQEHQTEAQQEFSTQDLLGNLVCPMPQSQQLFNEPLVQTNEFTRFEASAPLEPSTFTELSNGFNNFATAFTEQFSIKTDSIKPEFAEPAVITPSEDSKIVDEVFAAPLSEIPTQESLQTEVKSAEPVTTSQEASKELPVLAPLPIVPVVPQETKEIKKEEKKSSTATAGKKPIGKVAPSKSSTAPSKPSATPKVPATKSSFKPVASSPKTGVPPRVPSKTGPLKPATTAAKAASSTTAATKPLLKPKTAPAPKPIEKKPLTNGDVKPAPRTTLTKRPSAETATKTTTRPATSAAAKTSPTKTTAPRPATAPRPTPPKLSASAPKPPVGTTTAPKPRVPLASRPTTTSSTSKLVTSTTTSKTTTATTNRPSLSPRTSTAPPKPKTITYNAPKPRVPLTKTITKSADVEKEKKESANKLTASRTTTVTKTSSASATSRTATTTVKKTETKPLSHRPAVSKTSTTTTKTTVSKKPGEVKSVTKTKTTKVEKPKENGVAPTNITEEIKEITIVNNIVNETENLFKDNSPLDNKLITETSALIDVNPAD